MKWSASLITHKNEKRIAVYFENTPELNNRIKQLAGAKWISSLSDWHVPDTLENRHKFKSDLEALTAKVDSNETGNRMPITTIEKKKN